MGIEMRMAIVSQLIVLLSVLYVVQSCSNGGGRRVARMCEESLGDAVCEGLLKTSKILKLKGDDAEDFVRDASQKGIKGGRDLKRFIKDRIDRELSRKPCQQILGKRQCRKIKEYAKKVGASASQVRDSIKNVISDGASNVGKVYDGAMRKIRKGFGKSRFSHDKTHHNKKNI